MRIIGAALATGLVLAWVTVATGTLYPAMAVPALSDMRILALPDLEPARSP